MNKKHQTYYLTTTPQIHNRKKKFKKKNQSNSLKKLAHNLKSHDLIVLKKNRKKNVYLVNCV